MTDPVVPQNPRLRLPGHTPDEEIPLRLERGPDRDGQRVFVGYGPPGDEIVLRPPFQILCDVLPGLTSLAVAFEVRDGVTYLRSAAPSEND